MSPKGKAPVEQGQMGMQEIWHHAERSVSPARLSGRPGSSPLQMPGYARRLCRQADCNLRPLNTPPYIRLNLKTNGLVDKPYPAGRENNAPCKINIHVLTTQ